MKLPVPIHLRYHRAEGPVDAYWSASPWTKEMGQALQEAFALAEPRGALMRRVDYRCPECESSPEQVTLESVTFFADDDLHQLHPVAEAQLITMVGCGHHYRRELSRSASAH